jgi:damage-control phosphatase, subfamily I
MRAMRTYLDCIPCLCRQALDAARLATDDEAIHEQVLRRSLAAAGEMDLRQSPPAMARQMHHLIAGLTGARDPYAAIKARCNERALKLYPDLSRRVAAAADPLDAGVRMAIAGNIIDFGAASAVEDALVTRTIAEAWDAPLIGDAVDGLRRALAGARHILYLGDNAGEIVFDRLLIEQLPTDRITYVVKAGPIINDVTRADAKSVGLTDIVEVIDNGSDAPGAVLDTCSETFRQRFAAADLVISKGQGNYEGLSESAGDIFFLLKVKCQVIARDLGCEVGRMVLKRNRRPARAGL